MPAQFYSSACVEVQQHFGPEEHRNIASSLLAKFATRSGLLADARIRVQPPATNTHPSVRVSLASAVAMVSISLSLSLSYKAVSTVSGWLYRMPQQFYVCTTKEGRDRRSQFAGVGLSPPVLSNRRVDRMERQPTDQPASQPNEPLRNKKEGWAVGCSTASVNFDIFIFVLASQHFFLILPLYLLSPYSFSSTFSAPSAPPQGCFALPTTEPELPSPFTVGRLA